MPKIIHTKPCKWCGKLFEKRVSDSKKKFYEKRHFCSLVCCHYYAKKNPNKGTFKKGESFLDKINHRSDCKCQKCNPRKGSKNNKWKGGKIDKECLVCTKPFRVPRYREKTAKFCSKDCSTKHKQSESERRRMSDIHKKRVAQGIHNLYTGATAKNELLRKSSKYKEWRKKVFERDDFTCQICKKRGCEIHADHIKQFAYFPELRFDVSNGRTLCVDCHKQTDTYCRKLKV